MSREPIDLSAIKPQHESVHQRLVNWARWCHGGSGGSAVHPMFREYRNAYDDPAETGIPCDTLDAASMQKTFIHLPEKHRWVVCWWYCKPYIPVMRVRQALGLSTPALMDMINDSRSMLINLSA